MVKIHENYGKKEVGGMVKYKVVVRFYGTAHMINPNTGKFSEVIVENPELVRIVPFPSPETGICDGIGIYEFVPIEEEKKEGKNGGDK